MSNINYSIIIPHKNVPQLLQRCLNSIPIRDDVQVIVIDDNSDADKVDFNNFPKWSGKNYEYHLTKEGKGAGYARNIGIKHAIGKWLLFADADDTFNTKALDFLLNKPKDDYDVICWPTDITLTNGNVVPYPYQQRADYQLFDYSNIGQHSLSTNKDSSILFPLFEPWHKMCTRDLIEKYKIRYSEVLSCNDALFSVKLAQRAKNVAVYSDIIYHYIKRPSSLSFVITQDRIEQRMKELFRIQHILVEVGKDNFVCKDIDDHFKLLSKKSFIATMKECFLQMYIVSIKTGYRSFKRHVLPIIKNEQR